MLSHVESCASEDRVEIKVREGIEKLMVDQCLATFLVVEIEIKLRTLRSLAP